MSVRRCVRFILAMVFVLRVTGLLLPRSSFIPESFSFRFTSHSCHGSGRWWWRRDHRSMATAAALRRSSLVMMPEGPEVRTLVNRLEECVVGRRLVNVQLLSGRYTRHGPPDGFRDFAATMTQYRNNDNNNNKPNESVADTAAPVDMVQECNCKGKFIYMILDHGGMTTNETDYQRSIFITLGMSGRFVSEAANQRDDRFARWYMEFLDIHTKKINRVYYHDQRNFGTLKFSLNRQDLVEKLDSLGPDIMAETTTPTVFLGIVSKQRPDTNICKFLMDQRKLSGVGNYILAEGLYRARVDPFASLQELNEIQLKKLFSELQATALESYQSQQHGLSRSKGGPYREIGGEKGRSAFQLQCYGRQVCIQGNPVLSRLGPHGRTIWYTDGQLMIPIQERSLEKIEVNAPSATMRTTRKLTVGRTPPSDHLISTLMDSGWKYTLSDAIKSQTFQQLSQFIEQEWQSGATIYPPHDEIFAALNMCPLENVKVVIVGQDPYHGRGQSHGLAFSVREGVKPPPSLQNIFREAMDDVGIRVPQHGSLMQWTKQGVLLLNAVLTVREGKANSHAGKGWEEFTDAIIQRLNDERKGLVFLLWGNPAIQKARHVDESRHVIIRTSHPSPLGATKTKSPFLTSRCFSRVNQVLMDMGQTPIDWNVS